MLNNIQADLRELLELVRDVASYDATLAASQIAGNSIQPGEAAFSERARKAARIGQLKQKYDL
jgi:hypothetical protein